MRILGLMLTVLCIQVTGWGQQVATQRTDVELKKLIKPRSPGPGFPADVRP